ncbi:MAG: T9SS type A sorting domain-containing protein [Bacteroidota bacterium]
MIRKITILIALILFTTSNYAQVREYKRYLEPNSFSFTKKFGKVEKGMKQNIFLRKMAFQKREDNLKTSLANKYTLDSIVLHEPVEPGEWGNKYKEVYTYDANGNMDQYISYFWDYDIIQWSAIYKAEYTYDSSENLLQIVEFGRDWDENQWYEEFKEEYSYDDNGNMILSVTYYYDLDISQWMKLYKEEYTYDISGNMIQSIFYDWDYTYWDADYKDVYTYNANGAIIQIINYNWDFTLSQWVEEYKWEYTYDASENMILETEYVWNETASQWNENYKWEYAFDTNGKIILETEYIWNESTSQWDEGNKWEYSYDTNRNIILEIEYLWNNETSQWNEEYKFNYTYDYSYSISDLILPFFYNFFYEYVNNMLTEFTVLQWNTNTNEWENSEKTVLYFSEQTNLSVSEVGKEDMKVYPNPFAENVRFSIPGNDTQITFKLFDVQGRKLISRVINNNENVNLESLEGGMYFYNLTVEGKRLKGKLIKK